MSFIFRRRVTSTFIAEEEQPTEKREDIYVKHCKNRLANLAGQYKNFEDEVTPHPTPIVSTNGLNPCTWAYIDDVLFNLQKKQTTKRRSAERKRPAFNSSPRKENQNARFGNPQKKIINQSPRPITKTPEKATLEESVVQSLVLS